MIISRLLSTLLSRHSLSTADGKRTAGVPPAFPTIGKCLTATERKDRKSSKHWKNKVAQAFRRRALRYGGHARLLLPVPSIGKRKGAGSACFPSIGSHRPETHKNLNHETHPPRRILQRGNEVNEGGTWLSWLPSVEFQTFAWCAVNVPSPFPQPQRVSL